MKGMVALLLGTLLVTWGLLYGVETINEKHDQKYYRDRPPEISRITWHDQDGCVAIDLKGYSDRLEVYRWHPKSVDLVDQRDLQGYNPHLTMDISALTPGVYYFMVYNKDMARQSQKYTRK